MLKKILCLTLCIIAAVLAGCSKKTDTLSVDSGMTTQPSQTPQEQTYVNSLTGEDGLTKAESLQRPVAIMVNNIAIAQPVQTGLTEADIVYETEVEGGITRLLAVYQDFKSVEKIGSVRSSRYVYIDLAAGHNAVYAYHGIDKLYAKSHLSAVDSIQVDTDNGGARLSNGLASEHTLYAYGNKVWNSIKSEGIDTSVDNSVPWQTFAKDGNPVKLDYTADAVTVPFSDSYKTTFRYDTNTGKYTRFFNGTERKDYNTKESVTVKNVFVLNTTISSYSDGYHRNVNLTSGSGYYFVNGTYTKINWSKGAASNGFVFTNTDGTELVVDPGNSWVCIADKTRSQPVIGE